MRTRQRADSGTRPVPWERWIGTGCCCDPVAPCLLHFDGLDGQARARTYAYAGIIPPAGRAPR
jgi:hypothetical protein